MNILEDVKKLKKLALPTAPENKSNKQHNQASHSFRWQLNKNFSTERIFRSQQIWGDKKHVSVQSRLAVR